ncbi:hypothetical protein HPB50_019975 [Hyalomma asiaticum]|uniref:Uncharacterized protein n=1 Tax=Hyalomma asiaticum TaxID=266040 RepID=A0ACB7SU04_HYAAI|nr:hypothetical protein HPB50_019975 [Hyalomma asiaticum]
MASVEAPSSASLVTGVGEFARSRTMHGVPGLMRQRGDGSLRWIRIYCLSTAAGRLPTAAVSFLYLLKTSVNRAKLTAFLLILTNLTVFPDFVVTPPYSALTARFASASMARS